MRVTYFNNDEILQSHQLNQRKANTPIEVEKSTPTNSSFNKIWRKVQQERLLGDTSSTPEPFDKRKKASRHFFEDEMLSEKYKPKNFFDLVGEHRINTDILSWLKAHGNNQFEANPYFYFDEACTRVFSLSYFYSVLLSFLLV